MANIQSQIKRNRQNEKRRVRNKAVRSTVKTFIKRFDRTADAGDTAAAADAYRAAARKLDKAAETGVVHRNYAANQKAKMSKKLSSLS
jgi:small subunit ribosomal protein S20